jgi:DtxR family Mn-dependent transcriptional regulator
VNYAPYDVVTLTGNGTTVAGEIVRRHEALKSFFVRVLAIHPDIAEKGACGMEHAMPREILERLTLFAECLRTNPVGNVRWTAEGFEFFSREETEGGV